MAKSSTERVRAWRKRWPERDRELNRTGWRRRKLASPSGFAKGLDGVEINPADAATSEGFEEALADMDIDTEETHGN